MAWRAALLALPAAGVDVRAFGAVGDGVTKDTAAVQRAVDSGAGEVVFPRGGVFLTGTVELRSDLVVRVEGVVPLRSL